jgi:DNA-binding NtrC family response regulator
MRLGAVDYLPKPFGPEELLRVVDRVCERSALIRENAALRRELRLQQGFQGIIGTSAAMEQVFSLVKRVGPSEGTVLITGESGTGKEMVARALHRLSPRAHRPLLACDCSTLAPTLLESELFGHTKGSFSGAIATKKGLFEAADGGTLFLDEVGNINLETQGKLLRAIETRRVRRVGDTAERSVDIRLIAATNRDLPSLIERGEFREDLFYRLDVVPIPLPPLRERRGDVALLAVSFLEQFMALGRATRARRFGPQATRLMERYRWPGNVRELRNVVERVAILCDTEEVEPRHLPEEIRKGGYPLELDAPPLPTTWDELKALKREVQEAAARRLERRFIRKALERADGNVTRAAEEVGMQRTHLHALIRRHSPKAPPEEG